MDFYLSSYRLGNKPDELKRLMSKNKKIGYIPNAGDINGKNNPQSATEALSYLRELGLAPELLDLQNYFNNQTGLEKKLNELGGVWVRGGNVFVLRQAMRLSGFDNVIKKLNQRNDFLYGGYSAAGCVLSPTLDAYKIVDDPTVFPYQQLKTQIWEGLNLIDYAFLPHWQSDHPESTDIEKEIEYCKKNNIPYRTLRDGEVIIIEN